MLQNHEERSKRGITSGGRVITATVATEATHQQAVDRAYQGVELIQFEGMQYRRDIGEHAPDQEGGP